MNDSDTDVVRTLATQLNFGGLYAEEVCTRAGIEKAMDIEEADEGVYDRLYEAIERLALDIRNGNFEPRLYLEREEDGNNGDDDSDDGDDGDASEQVVDVTPFPLEEHEAEGLVADGYDSFLAALDDYFFRLELEEESAPDPTEQKPDFDEEVAKYERIIEQQQGAISGFEQELMICASRPSRCTPSMGWSTISSRRFRTLVSRTDRGRTSKRASRREPSKVSKRPRQSSTSTAARVSSPSRLTASTSTWLLTTASSRTLTGFTPKPNASRRKKRRRTRSHRGHPRGSRGCKATPRAVGRRRRR